MAGKFGKKGHDRWLGMASVNPVVFLPGFYSLDLLFSSLLSLIPALFISSLYSPILQTVYDDGQKEHCGLWYGENHGRRAVFI